eukprot:TRINITY_DN20403_c0_g2_i2.p1 TRINITY_DN20403_c0_g2~~TRINITY_DN20403_c0_g2_i2.p1  ORF type:complete len:143 (-),score=21.37 TRINITY_DN20403_c0_g2_i2:102-530(-)
MDSQTAVGLSPERVQFNLNGFEVVHAAPWTVHRPETVESLYVLASVTGEQKYRDWGWDSFTAMERCCRTNYGYGAHPDVRKKSTKCCQGNDDRSETYFFAETLKYLYLLFSDSDATRLERFVFNTEAHPFPQRRATDFPLFL